MTKLNSVSSVVPTKLLPVPSFIETSSMEILGASSSPIPPVYYFSTDPANLSSLSSEILRTQASLPGNYFLLCNIDALYWM